MIVDAFRLYLAGLGVAAAVVLLDLLQEAYRLVWELHLFLQGQAEPPSGGRLADHQLRQMDQEQDEGLQLLSAVPGLAQIPGVSRNWGDWVERLLEDEPESVEHYDYGSPPDELKLPRILAVTGT